MHIFSFFIIVILFWSFIKSSNFQNLYINILSFSIFVCISIEIGNFISVGNIEIKYNIFLLIISFLFSIYFIFNNLHSVPKRDVFKFMLAIIVPGIGLINLALFPLHKLMVTGNNLPDYYWRGITNLSYPSVDSTVITNCAQYLVFLLILSSIYLSFQKKDYIFLLRQTGNWCKITVLFGWIEFVFKNIFRSNALLYFDTVIFGPSKNVFTSMEQRGSLFRLQGWSLEASHFSYALFIISIVFLALTIINERYVKWVFLSSILMIFTMSFSSLLFFISFLIIFLCYKKRASISGIQIFRFFLYITLLIGIVLLIINMNWFKNSYFGERMLEMRDNLSIFFTDISQVRGLQYTSTRVRLISSFSTLRLLVYRPLFGIGLGTLSSHGSFSSILAGMGILGTYSWLNYLFFGHARALSNIFVTSYVLMIIIWCITGIFNSHFWGMLYHNENFVLMISFLLLSEKKNLNIEGKPLQKKELSL